MELDIPEPARSRWQNGLPAPGPVGEENPVVWGGVSLRCPQVDRIPLQSVSLSVQNDPAQRCLAIRRSAQRASLNGRRKRVGRLRRRRQRGRAQRGRGGKGSGRGHWHLRHPYRRRRRRVSRRRRERVQGNRRPQGNKQVEDDHRDRRQQQNSGESVQNRVLRVPCSVFRTPCTLRRDTCTLHPAPCYRFRHSSQFSVQVI